MRTDAEDQARVRDPAIELLLGHTATLTDEWCSRRRARRQLGLDVGEIRPTGEARSEVALYVTEAMLGRRATLAKVRSAPRPIRRSAGVPARTERRDRTTASRTNWQHITARLEPVHGTRGRLQE